MKVALMACLCYLIGCINPAYFIGKAKGFDIRSRGSLNAGASNVVINVGKKAGVFTALFDMFKSFFCFKLGGTLFPLIPFAAVLCAVMCVMGHIFPFYLRFKGGKGFACLGGLILSFNFKVFLIMLLCAVLVVLAVDYLCVVTSLTSLSFPIVYFSMTGDLLGAILLLFIGLVIISKHFPNFKRIKIGTEARFSGLWHREDEERRLRNNIEKQSEEEAKK